MRRQYKNNKLLKNGKDYVITISKNNSYIFIDKKKYHVSFSDMDGLTIEPSGDIIHIFMFDNNVKAIHLPWVKSNVISDIHVGDMVKTDYIAIIKRLFNIT